MSRRQEVRYSVRHGLWFLPAMCVAAGIGLSLVTLTIDRRAGFDLIPSSFTGGPEAAIGILSTVAYSMVSLAALVLTITMVVVQLAMGQFSPRIVQTFLEDKPSQLAVGLFVATFAHSLLALREVRVDEGTVPGLAIIVAFVMVLVSIGVLALYVHHIGESLRVSSLIELVGDKTRALLDEVYADRGQSPDVEDDRVVVAPSSGVITQIDHDALVTLASRDDVVLELEAGLGQFVPGGAPVVRIHGDGHVRDHSAISGAVTMRLERTLDQDVAYGLRLLVDIAERSVADSPFQDPTTAVQAIDRIHDCLRQLAPRPFPSGEHRDHAGVVRLVVPVMDWDAYVHLAFDEIRLAGAGSPQISRRLRAVLDDLLCIAPPERRAALLEQRDLLATSTAAAAAVPGDVDLGSHADGQGLGIDAGSSV